MDRLLDVGAGFMGQSDGLLAKGIATEDSTPQSAMRKLYNKKRGF